MALRAPGPTARSSEREPIGYLDPVGLEPGEGGGEPALGQHPPVPTGPGHPGAANLDEPTGWVCSSPVRRPGITSTASCPAARYPSPRACNAVRRPPERALTKLARRTILTANTFRSSANGTSPHRYVSAKCIWRD